MGNRLGITIIGSEQGEGDLGINRTTAERISIDPMLKTLLVGKATSSIRCHETLIEFTGPHPPISGCGLTR